MNREIKFKCLTECSDMHVKLGFPKHRWVTYGLSGKYIFPEYKMISPDLQYTGLKDKNGKEIYEGDILTHEKLYKTKHEMLFVMEYDSERARFSDYSPKEEFIIIGNVYSNPELLTPNKQ